MRAQQLLYAAQDAKESRSGEARAARLQEIARSGRAPILALIEEIHASCPDCSRGKFLEEVSIGGPADPGGPFAEKLREGLNALIPWRKGPFDLFGIRLDAEWRSDLKFSRLGLTPADVCGKNVADVGCGNGYYMFRLLGLEPRLVVGFDPADRYLLQYLLLRGLVPGPLPLAFEPFRSDALENYPEFFELTLCLGVLYHHPNPDLLLRDLFQSCAAGGVLYLETLFAPGETSISLSGHERYARMKNVYLIPSLEHLREMILKSGFSKVELISELMLTEDEQRSTPYAPGESLSDFLDPRDKSLTVEGHPRPHRVIARAAK